MTRTRRTTALALCLGIVLVLVFSSVIIIHEADHVCVSEDCEICAQVTAAVLLQRGFALAGMILPALLAGLFAARKYRSASHRFYCASPSLIAWKIRLND